MEYADIIRASATEMVASLHELVWSISPSEDSVEQLVEKLEEYASKMAAADINYTSGTEGNYIRQTNMMPDGELEYCFKLLASSKGN